MAFDKVSYDREYIKEHYDRVEIIIPKGGKAELKSLAKAQDMSMTQLLMFCVKQVFGLDLSN